ncbi:pyridoxal phosphate-dependent aminotransferase [Parvularcula sp. LCG005]|uniref:pyridoxal phosphate-dependent aminotransferase n=1 Tax=Parvularcula sp. LCG005 TaxID=3078805 RepID=UPI0029423332|nr:aminotransferase class I/II-fold pyridoxal phosphate-dependent enzyme [Parvularcula sp. LCG005]WOI53808.1 aminotransferase class I/II-fold pyridoxal phosphate-dependent enzyme [Parvularcula sp. LCG005]
MTKEIRPFHAMTIGRLAFQMQAEGRSIVHMQYGQPSARPPAAVMSAAADMLDAGVPGYWQNEELTAAIADTYSSLYGVSISTAQIFLTCGASPAMVLALTAGFAPGARIAMAKPGYVAHRNTVIGLNMEPVELTCGSDTGFQLTADMIRSIDPAPDGLIVASPANPTGSIIPRDEMAAIADACAKRGIRIISDEIYNRLTYDAAAASITEFTTDAFVVNSFSKFYLMPGWRLGWLVVPEEQIDRTVAINGNFFLTPPSLSQAAALAAMSCTDELTSHLDTYRRNRAHLLEALPRLGLTEMAPPDGAFYIYANVDEFTDDSRVLCRELLEQTGVATASGVDFDPEEGHRYMRFSFAVTEAEVLDAIARMTPFFESRRRSA